MLNEKDRVRIKLGRWAGMQGVITQVINGGERYGVVPLDAIGQRFDVPPTSLAASSVEPLAPAEPQDGELHRDDVAEIVDGRWAGLRCRVLGGPAGYGARRAYAVWPEGWNKPMAVLVTSLRKVASSPTPPDVELERAARNRASLAEVRRHREHIQSQINELMILRGRAESLEHRLQAMLGEGASVSAVTAPVASRGVYEGLALSGPENGSQGAAPINAVSPYGGGR